MWFEWIPQSSRRETFYVPVSFIGEFWCTLSNIGFLSVSWKTKNPWVGIAGIASILCHSYPIQGLLYIDKVCAIVAGISLTRNIYRNWTKNKTKTTLFVASVLTCNIMDYFLSNTYPGLQPIPHVVWHLYAAFFAFSISYDPDSLHRNISTRRRNFKWRRQQLQSE